MSKLSIKLVMYYRYGSHAAPLLFKEGEVFSKTKNSRISCMLVHIWSYSFSIEAMAFQSNLDYSFTPRRLMTIKLTSHKSFHLPIK